MPFINGIGPGELIIILIIALIVVGPGKLPDVGSALGKSIREFRKASTEVKESVSLDATPAATTTATPAATPAPVAQVAPPAPVPPIVPVPPIATAEPVPAPVETASGADAPAAGTAAAAPTGTWPAEVTPVDEQQPTASA